MLSDRQKFIKWYVRPFNRLKKIQGGDGAFIILSMGFFLCERYYRIKSNTITKHWKLDPFLKKAARDFDCDLILFTRFWNLFRHGMQHQGQPKIWIEEKPPGLPKRRIYLRWIIGAEFGYKPSLCRHKDKRIIAINPDSFARFMLWRFLKNPLIMKRSISHSFGRIFPLPAECRCEEITYR